MLQNAFIVSLRLMKRNGLQSVIKITGMVVGISCVMVALLYMRYEFSFDRFHSDADNIYRICRETERGTIASTAFPLVPTLKEDFGDYQFTRFFKDRSKTLFRNGDRSFYEEGMIFADVDFLKTFSFEGFRGDPETALEAPYSLVVTEDMALKYFGDLPRLGDRLDFKWNGEYYPLTITGIIPQWPANMHIQFEALVSFKTGEQVFPGGISNGWNMNYCYSYVKLPSGTQKGDFESQFGGFFSRHIDDKEKDHEAYLGRLQPLTSIHTEPEVIAGYTSTIDPVYPRLAVAIGVFILIITMANFITLTLVQLQHRVRELNIRQAIGATRRQLLSQLTIETLVLVALSATLALGVVYWLVDLVNSLIGASLHFGALLNIFWAIPLVIAAVTLIAGSYPAWMLKTSQVSGTSAATGTGDVRVRRGLLTFQFVLAAMLIGFTITLRQQLQFIQNADPGYDREQVIFSPFARQIRYDSQPFKSLALQHPAVQQVTLSFYKPTDNMGLQLSIKANGREAQPINATSVDEDFFSTFGIDLVDGRFFTDSEYDAGQAFILNEAAVRLLELDNPLDAILETTYNTGNPNTPTETRKGRVIGVVEDVRFESLHNAVKPMAFIVKPYWYYYISVRLSGNVKEGIQHVAQSWETLFPDRPFDYQFLDDEFARQYHKEEQLASGFSIMTLLAIITTCLGLFAYIQFVAQRRTKEVGIRKVLGADHLAISRLFSKDLLWPLLIANVVATPLAFYVSGRWLETFAYHTALTLWPSVLTLLVLAIVVSGTVFRELMKIMRLNPTTALRYE